MQRLKGQVAIITGGAGGIGAVTAERFIGEGATVVVADIDLAHAQAVADRLGPNALPMALDIGDEAAFKAAIDTTVERFGKLDILFNNAALTNPETLHQDTDITAIPAEVWTRILHVNLTGYMFGCRHAIPHMAANGGGTIVNMASGAGQAADASRVAYGASKAGVISLTQYVATQHAHQRVRCNAIAPGPVITPTFRKVAPELIAIIGRHALTPELGEPEDIAALATFLASRESKYINGQVITIDGGMSAHHAHVMDLQDHMRGA